MIKAILFDKDGTLFDIDATWAQYMEQLVTETLKKIDIEIEYCQKLLREIGIEEGKIIANSTFATQPAQKTIRELIQAIASIDKNLTAIEIEDAMQQAVTELGEPQAVAMAGLKAVIEHCQQKGIQLGIATMDTEVATVNQLIAHQLLSAFSFIATSDNCEYIKPQAQLVECFSEKTGVTKAEIAVVGDSWNDIQLGINAGIKKLFYISTTSNDCHSEEAYVITNLEELLRFI